MNALKCRTSAPRFCEFLKTHTLLKCKPPHARILKAHVLLLLLQRSVTGSIRKTLVKRGRIRRKKLATFHRVVFHVAFSQLLRPLEGSAVEKMCRMSLQYPRRLSQVSKWCHNFWTERFQRKPHKFFHLRCSLSTWQKFQQEQTLQRGDVT